MTTHPPLVKNASDESQVKGAGDKAKRREQRDAEDLQLVLGSIQGRRLLWRYLSRCGVFQSSFSTNGSITFYNEGKRSIGLEILAEITATNPDAYLQMMKESKGDQYV
jgi:hypothetical protein